MCGFIQGWTLVPLRKFLWVSKIWRTSSSQASFISGDDACMMKRVTLLSVPREVRTRQQGSSFECSSTPKQLTWTTQEKTWIKRYFADVLKKQCYSHLDAVFKSVPWQREALFLVNWLTKNDQLLKQENPPLLGSGQEAIFLLTDRERILLKKLPLSCDFPLK